LEKDPIAFQQVITVAKGGGPKIKKKTSQNIKPYIHSIAQHKRTLPSAGKLILNSQSTLPKRSTSFSRPSVTNTFKEVCTQVDFE